jgi:prefoldin subunit 5
MDLNETIESLKKRKDLLKNKTNKIRGKLDTMAGRVEALQEVN